MKKLFKLSKWIHKYIGLLLVLFLMWESASGILMNHPELISNISVPGWLIPSHYHIENWNRSSLTRIVYSNTNKERLFGSGKLGVWESNDGGKTFYPFMKGYTESYYYLKTNDLFLHENDSLQILFAAADDGLYYNSFIDNVWKQINLSEEKESVKRILPVEEQLVVFTESNVYRSNIHNDLLSFRKVELKRKENNRIVTLVDLFFHLHDGRVWGLPGRLLFDFVGLIIFFLSLSAFYVWYFPKRLKRKRERKIPLNNSEKLFYRLFFKYHLKLGIWTAAITLIIAGTAFFMRPPLLAVIANGSVDAAFYPGILPENIWHEKIQNALYNPNKEKILIATKEGIFSGKYDFSENFELDKINAPIFVMGATVFEMFENENYLVGSFGGLFEVKSNTEKPFDLINKKELNDFSNVMPADIMVTGYFKLPDGKEFISAHEQGIIPLGSSKIDDRFIMPDKITNDFRMSLWNYLFEIHNGRFFQGIVGSFYILIVPLGSLFFLAIIFSGFYDWVYIKILKRKKKLI